VGSSAHNSQRLTIVRGPLRISSEVHAGWCSPRTSNPVVPSPSGRSVRFRLTSAKASRPDQADIVKNWKEFVSFVPFISPPWVQPAMLKAGRAFISSQPSAFDKSMCRNQFAGSKRICGTNPKSQRYDPNKFHIIKFGAEALVGSRWSAAHCDMMDRTSLAIVEALVNLNRAAKFV
jgi:hypothetical protein